MTCWRNILLLAGLVGAAAAWGEVATGVVFRDDDGDGRRSPREPGLVDVRVSNGREVVLTDADGRYAIAAGDEAVLFITKPAGYATPVDANMLPQFYYVHQPAGSPPGLRYPGIPPTGPLPDAVNFPLRERPEPSLFQAILFADTQPQTEKELDYIRDEVVAELIGTEAVFGMTMGDIAYDDLSLLPRLNSIIAQIGVPWRNVPGNHELNLMAAHDRHSLETFKRIYGPPYYAFEYGDAVFFVLDNIFYQGGGEVTADNVRGNGGYVAKFDERQLHWLANELAHVPKERLLFLAMHAPLETFLAEGVGVNTANRRDLFKLLADRPHLYAVAGHTHTTEHRYFGKEDGFEGPTPFHQHILATVSGSWWSGPFDERGMPTTDQRDGTPNGYHLLEVDGVQVKVRFKAAGAPADHQMRIMIDAHHHSRRPDGLRDFRPGELLDGRLSVDQVPAAAIYVNLFDGGPNSKVTFSVNGSQPAQMQRVEQKDPWMQELMARHADTKKSWVQPVPSSHLWAADLPDDLTPGTYTLSVEAVDEFGQSHHAHRILEIEGSAALPAGGLRYRRGG